MTPDPSSELLDEGPSAPLMLAPALSAIAVALFLYYGLTVVSQLVPLQLMLPAWQLSSSAALLNNALWPLLGLMLLQLAPLFDPGNWRLQDRWVGLGRLGVIAVLGFLLLVPVQLTATARSLQAMDSAQRTRQQELQSNLQQMRQEIRSATSLADLLQRIRDIQPPDLMIDAASLDQPLPQLKRSFLASVDRSEQNLRQRIRALASRGRTWAVLRRSGREVLLALVLAFASAAASPLARNPEFSILMVWRERLGLLRMRRMISSPHDEHNEYLRKLSG